MCTLAPTPFNRKQPLSPSITPDTSESTEKDLHRIHKAPASKHAVDAEVDLGGGDHDCDDRDPNERPPYSYSQLAVLALEDLGPSKVTAIYTWIKKRFPFYEKGAQYWRNCIRHNLSTKKYFQRKDVEWMYVPALDTTPERRTGQARAKAMKERADVRKKPVAISAVRGHPDQKAKDEKSENDREIATALLLKLSQAPSTPPPNPFPSHHMWWSPYGHARPYVTSSHSTLMPPQPTPCGGVSLAQAGPMVPPYHPYYAMAPMSKPTQLFMGPTRGSFAPAQYTPYTHSLHCGSSGSGWLKERSTSSAPASRADRKRPANDDDDDDDNDEVHPACRLKHSHGIAERPTMTW